uniref:Uncharacterized protein n=1 Tax=Astyanax mexicanus TaxID=7994 RepID=A0A3B1IR93_ASTMX
ARNKETSMAMFLLKLRILKRVYPAFIGVTVSTVLFYFVKEEVLEEEHFSEVWMLDKLSPPTSYSKPQFYVWTVGQYVGTARQYVGTVGQYVGRVCWDSGTVCWESVLGQWDSMLVQWDSMLGQWDSMLGQWDSMLGQWDSTLGQQVSMLGQWDSMLGQWDNNISPKLQIKIFSFRAFIYRK